MPAIVVKDVIESDQALNEMQGAQLFQRIYAALIIPRHDKVVVDFEGITKVQGEFLAAGLTALMGPFKGDDLAVNLDIINLDKVYLVLLKKINDRYRQKMKNHMYLEGLCHEVNF